MSSGRFWHSELVRRLGSTWLCPVVDGLNVADSPVYPKFVLYLGRVCVRLKNLCMYVCIFIYSTGLYVHSQGRTNAAN